MSIFDIEEQPITEKGLLELGFIKKSSVERYIMTYRLKEENISITYSVTVIPQGDFWSAYINIDHFGFRMTCTSIKHIGGTFVSHKVTTWSSLDMHDDWKVPPLEMEVKTLNDLIILTSDDVIKQHCKEFITNDKILW